MYCPNCGQSLPEDAMFCNSCGSKLTTASKTCIKCGTSLNEGDVFCGECGTVQSSCINAEENNINLLPPPSKRKKSWIIILSLIIVLLATFVGAFIYFSVDGDIELTDNVENSISEVQPNNNEKAVDNDFNNNSTEYAEHQENVDTIVDTEEHIEYSTPSFTTVTASSILHSDGTFNYSVENIIDNDISTSWVEGAEGCGQMEWIEFSADTEQKVSQINILNGYCKNQDIYTKNNRIKEVKVEFDDGTYSTHTLKDKYNEWNFIKFDKEHICKKIKIYIISVYEGSHYNDTCVSEIDFK